MLQINFKKLSFKPTMTKLAKVKQNLNKENQKPNPTNSSQKQTFFENLQRKNKSFL